MKEDSDEELIQAAEEVEKMWNDSTQYELVETRRRTSKKFKTECVDYKLKVKSYNTTTIKDVVERLGKVFEEVVEKVTANLDREDQVRFVMQSAQLDHAVSLPFMPVRDLTASRILTEVERVLQSYQSFSLDGAVHLNVITVDMPHGQKWKSHIRLEERLKNKRCFIEIRNKDELCLSRAIVVGVARLEEDPQWNSIRAGKSIQRTRALELHTKAGVPIQAGCGMEEVKQFQAVLPEYQLVVVSAEHFNAIIYKGPQAPQQIYLYYHHGHFDLITSMPAFLNKSYFCPKCWKGYDHDDFRNHSCDKCRCCGSENCPGGSGGVECPLCLRSFKSQGCLANHKQGGAKSVCATIRKCVLCLKTLDLTQQKRGKAHQCGEIECRVCKEMVDPTTHQCYMQPLKHQAKEEAGGSRRKKKKVETEYYFFDFETVQETGEHTPILLVVQDMEGQETVFQGLNCKNDFCDWVFDGEKEGAVFLAHNLKGFDGYFILQYLYDNVVLPSLILNGSKVMVIDVVAAKIKFIDSLNFLAMPLKAFPKTFGLEEMTKGYFPHLFNTEANQSYVGPLPDAQHYDPDGMKSEEREAFLKWYEEQKEKNVVFDLQADMLKYCRNDVDILRRACLKFRQEIMDIAAIDPFENSITIASVCSTILRQNFLAPDTIAIIPPRGYRVQAKQSVTAYRWLAWVNYSTGVYIQHGRNSGEKSVGPYLLDGYEPQTNTAYEFNGCFYHGCQTCFARGTVNPFNGFTMEELHERTQERRKFLERQGLQVVEMWECQWKEMLKQNEVARKYVESLAFVDPLDPRDAFFGGRTNSTKLYVNVCESMPEGSKIKYVDFTSLYPFINKNGVYPVGHPTILTDNLSTDISEYFGLIQCQVLAPRALYHPLLPYRANGKLLFSLCCTCCESQQQTPCQHTDAERAFLGTWASPELDKAVELGYQVLHVYEVWHFQERSSDLFKGYVNTFLKRKQECSGWPSWCTTEEEKERYLHDYKDKEGIELDRDKIEKNEGARSIFKIILNNMWGKLGQRANFPKTEVTADPKVFLDLLTSSEMEVTNALLVNDEIMEVYYRLAEEFVLPATNTNVVLAAFTTALARLKLYSVLEPLGKRVCYYDTDSVVYTVAPGEWEPPLGDYLGELTSEIKPVTIDNEVHDDYITEFVGCGPKNYSYRTFHGKTESKVRGIRLNYRSQQLINLKSMTELVQKQDGTTIEVVNPHKIVRDKADKSVRVKKETKVYKIVYDKRVIQSDLDTLPYGY